MDAGRENVIEVLFGLHFAGVAAVAAIGDVAAACFAAASVLSFCCCITLALIWRARPPFTLPVLPAPHDMHTAARGDTSATRYAHRCSSVTIDRRRLRTSIDLSKLLLKLGFASLRA